jgi:hypothetical protein
MRQSCLASILALLVIGGIWCAPWKQKIASLKELLSSKRFWLRLFAAISYIAIKYSIAFAAIWLAGKFGICVCCIFLIVSHAIISYTQLRAYDSAQDILNTTAWIQRIKNGELTRWFHWYLWILFNFGGKFMFLLLATQFDPFVTTAYIRDTDGLKWSPTATFLWAFTIGIIYSTLAYTSLGRLIFG